MQKKYSNKFIQVLTVLILAVFPLQLIFSAVQKDTGVPTFEEEEAVFWGETTIEVIEGELTVYEFAIAMGEEELGVFLEQEMVEAVLFKIISDDLAKVTVRDGGLTVDAYIPVHLRKIIKKYGYSGMPVLVVEHHRELYDTDWDIVALGKVIKAGEVYVSGTIFPMIKEPAPVTGIEKVLAEAVSPGIIELPPEEVEEDGVPEDKPPDEPTTGNGEEKTTTTDIGTWEQVGGNGFGVSAPLPRVIYDITNFGSALYAATDEGPGGPVTGGMIFQSSDGSSWTRVLNTGGPDSNNSYFHSFAVVGSTLYVSSSNTTTGTEVLATTNGTVWNQVGADGLGGAVPANNTDSVLIPFQDLTVPTYLFAGSANATNGAGMFYYAASVWSQSNASGFGDGASNNPIDSLVEATFSGTTYLYTAVAGPGLTGVEIWRSSQPSGGQAQYSQVNTDGFGLAANTRAFAMTVFNGVLYVGTTNSSGARIYTTSNGTTWSSSVAPPFGSSVEAIRDFQIFNGYLYTATGVNPATGTGQSRIYRTSGTSWSLVRDFDDVDSNITSIDSLYATSTHLYAGMRNNTDGCEVWRVGLVTSDPHITGRVYDSVSGENVTDVYTSLYRYRDGALMGTTTSNPYSFNVDVANYFLRVEKAGFTFPSKNVGAKVSGDHGEVFQGKDTEHVIDIPIDPGYPLTITKTANKKEVMIGDIITFNIAVENNNSIATLNEIVIEDEITAGFKYVSGSTYFDSDKKSDPTIASRAASFNIGKIPRYTTINVSYQVRVGTGVVPGTYKTDAVAKDSYRGWQMSEESGVKIDVIKDPLFELGTIIGKVFVDTNGNGVQDGETEAGVPNVRLVTEYGVVVYTDKFGRYHIPAVPPGTHVVKIDTNGLPQGVELTTERTYVLNVTEGILRKVNFGIKGIDTEEIERRKEQLRRDWAFPEDRKEREEEELGARSNSFFLVALGEGIVRNLSTSGNIDMVDHDERFKDGIHVDGKLAYYLKARVLGKFLVTSSLDTDRKKNQLFTNLDPDKYYPVYGDSSQIDFSAADTQNEFYVMVEYEKSYLVWGDFHTDIPAFSRTLHGAKLNYESSKKTKFDDPYTTAKAFFANERQMPAHDEFLGTGTSLYYLRHRDVVEGSEKMHVEVRHQVSKVVLASYPLKEEIDYEIDYDTGRVLLKRPLTSVDYLYSDSIISNDILRGNRVYLIADYEYQPAAGIRFDTWGGQATQQIGDHIMVGGTYINEEKADTHYELAGGDLVIKVNKETEVRGEYNYSEETQLGSTISSDGGLSFVEESDTFSSGKSGNSWAVSGKTKLLKNTDLNALYAHQDPYYSTTNSLATQGSRRLIVNAISHLTENLAIGVSHITQRLLSDTERVQSYLTGTNRAHTTTALLDYNPGKYDVRVEYQHQRVVNLISSYTYFGTRQLRDNDFIAGRVGYRFTDWLRAYLRGQGTTSGMANNQGTIGSEIRVSDKLSLNIAETIGNLGNSTLLGMSSKYGEDSDIYANIEIGTDAYAGSYTKTTYGQTSYIGKEERVYVETDYSSYKEGLLSGNVIGYEKKLGNNLALGVNYERSFVEKDVSAFSRDAGGVSLSYLDQDSLKISSKLECREDNNNDETRQWVTQNEIMWRLTDSITTFGRANYSLSTDRTADSDLAEFKEMGAGLAYRPVKSDRLNLLGKISYIEDDAPGSQSDFAQSSEERKYVYALEGAYDIIKYLQLVGKFAYKDNQEKVGPRDFTESDTYLYIGRLNFHITKKWDIAGEYRVLENTQTEDQKSGWLVEINRELLDHMWLGAGYNFTDFDDDLEHDNDYDAKGWFVRAVGKY